ncbi:hypothetical protein SNOD_16685 [Streptomyces nodosus]|uniref:Uncharacterized protein n=1 Tax=Streptomyces nodosus TaxID=40318 RepID=A0A0B5DD11_9ACTN|nr:hypothetical protein SNOD_16685 [Streptomyces nodosus]
MALLAPLPLGRVVICRYVVRVRPSEPLMFASRQKVSAAGSYAKDVSESPGQLSRQSLHFRRVRVLVAEDLQRLLQQIGC